MADTALHNLLTIALVLASVHALVLRITLTTVTHISLLHHALICLQTAFRKHCHAYSPHFLFSSKR